MRLEYISITIIYLKSQKVNDFFNFLQILISKYNFLQNLNNLFKILFGFPMIVRQADG
jgi:hypothetical protein